jgi:hypothetical protein
MDKLLEMLGANKLDESTQTQIREKLETLVEVKAQEKVNAILKEEKDKLVESYETKFEEYKEEITGKFSNFVDSVLDEELTIPDKIVEYAKKGELYSDLIEQFKLRLGVDEGLLDEEVKGLLREAKEEIIRLRDDLNSQISENLEVRKDAQELASEIYLRRKCDGLTEDQKKYVLEMLDGVVDKTEIDRKFDVILEAYKEKVDEKKVDEKDDEEKKGKGKVDEEEDEEQDEEEDEEEEEETKKKDESSSPFKNYVKLYQKVLQENKI